jgi:hypothetical protein
MTIVQWIQARTRVTFALLVAFLLIHSAVQAQGTLPREGVVFDDFKYDNASWISEVDSGELPPDGSLYGRNAWHTSEAGVTTMSRAWYQYLWQERSDLISGTSIRTTTRNGGTLTITLPAGNYPESRVSGFGDPHIASGFSARRGTWAARVTFSDLDPGHQAGLIQAFWLQGLAVAIAPDGSRRWNEVDFEWNNRFRGRNQERPYLHTGYTVGGSDHVYRYLAAPGLNGDGRLPPVDWTWSCNKIDGRRAQALREAECNRLLVEGGSAGAGPLPVTLMMHVSEEGVYFDVEADGPNGRVVSRTIRAAPVTELPLIALFSQHVAAGARLSEDRELAVDWFYYSPSTEVTIDDIHTQVTYIRTTLGAPRINTVPGLDLERPRRHLPGEASTYGMGALTTPISLDLSHNPETVRAGDMVSLSALPPLRHGAYRYTWRYRTQDTRGRMSRWRNLDGHFAATFAVPGVRSIVGVEFEVSVSELVSGEVLRNAFVQPVTQTFSVRIEGR